MELAGMAMAIVFGHVRFSARLLPGGFD